MIYLGKIFAVLAVLALAFAGLGFSPAVAAADDANGVTKVALSGEHEKGKGEKDSVENKAEEETDAMHEEMKKEMEDSDDENEEDES